MAQWFQLRRLKSLKNNHREKAGRWTPMYRTNETKNIVNCSFIDSMLTNAIPCDLAIL
jgi:hypothetical protein